MVIDNFPIGQTLIGIDVIEDQDFTFDRTYSEYYLEKVRLFFEDQIIILSPIYDTDEIEIEVNKNQTNGNGYKINTPFWAKSFLYQKLMTVWVCNNNQGYQDQIIFALGYLKPSLSFVSEGSAIKVFEYDQINGKGIPSYQKFFQPLLQITADGKKYSTKEVTEILIQEMKFTENLRNKIYQRIWNAKSYFLKVNVFSSDEKGLFQITERGKKLLEQNIKQETLQSIIIKESQENGKTLPQPKTFIFA